nr:MAG TPA: hypothetical protein [Caudoviricetes sp.]
MSRAHLFFFFFKKKLLTRAGKCDILETNRKPPPFAVAL